MRAHILRRLLISVPLVFLMTFLVFAVINLNPEASIQRYVMQPNVSFQFIEQEKERLGVYDPLPLRYLRWLGGVLGDVRFGRATRSLISFADAGVLRSVFGLRSEWPLPFEGLPVPEGGAPVELPPEVHARSLLRRASALTGEVANTGTTPARVEISARFPPDAQANASPLPVVQIDVPPESVRAFAIRAPDLARIGSGMDEGARLTIASTEGGPVEVRQLAVTGDGEVIRLRRKRPFLAMPFFGAGHTYTFQRLGSPYTRLVLPRTDWAPVGKVVAVEEVAGEPVERVETRGFRALRLDVGNPFPRRQEAELLVHSGVRERPSEHAFRFSVGPERRETVEFALEELRQAGVDLDAVHHLSVRARDAGGLTLSRTLLVVDDAPFTIGWIPNFGASYENNIPVIRRLAGRVRNTIFLVLASMLLTWVIALPFGVVAAVRQYSATDRVLSFISFIGMALPGFFLAILVRYVASLTDDPNSWLSFLPSLPTSGRVSAHHEELTALGRIVDLMRHAALPILVLAMGGMAGMQRVMRGTMLDVLRQPYITTARAKGLHERAVVYRHALRNAITPFVAGFGSVLPALIGGSALIEIVFNYPGVGQLMLPAVLNRDINLVMGNTLIAALLLVAGNLIADILLLVVDPRVSYD